MLSLASNSVGYGSNELRYGGTPAGIQFFNVTGDDLTLGMIKPSSDGSVTIQRLLASGYVDKNFVYSYVSGIPGFPDGWYNDEEENCDHVKIEKGEGFWIYSDSTSTSQKITTSGRVNYFAIQDIPLRPKGGTLICNPFPVSNTLGKLIPNSQGTITIQRLLSSGYVDKTFVYSYVSGIQGFTDGWYNDEEENCDHVSVNPGEALWFYSDDDSTTQTLTIATPDGYGE